MEELTKKIPLETRIQVTIELYYLANHWDDVFPLDPNTQEVMSLNDHQDAVLRLATPLVDEVLNEVKQWRQDGCPE